MLILITKTRASWVGKQVDEKPMGPGFESQVPQNLIEFCFQVITRSVQWFGPPYASRIHLPDGLQGKSNDPDWRFTKDPSQCTPSKLEKSNEAGTFWAWRFTLCTTKLGPNPLGLFLFSLSYFFLVNCLLIIFIITN